MAADRSIGRNVHLYDAKDRETVLGGLILTSGVTKSNFYSMVEILLLFQSSFTIGHENSATLVRNEEPLAPEKYYVVGSFTVNNEPCLTRTISLSTGSRLQSFRDEIRKRDGRCVITGKIVPGAYRNHWKGFEAAHIFPLAYEGHWVQHNFARWITIPAANGETINSKQNGLLLRADIHGLFDSYDISINPDDNHKIVCFADDGDGIAGKFLDEQFRNDHDRPSDELLRWHFRQAVFANMRGAGEPIFETDFPPGSDVLGEMCRGPKAAERMEFELFSRFAVSSDITWRYGNEVPNSNQECAPVARSFSAVVKQEVKDQRFVVNTKLEVVQISPPIDVDAMTASQIMGDLATKLSILAEQIGATAADQILLNNLWFNGLRQRQENVAYSHEKTFKCVLDPSSPTDFRKLVMTPRWINWITGKAGSGKSTLMKSLINHPDVAKASKVWAGKERLVNATFFFWNAGTAIRKSQEGLFKSLMYEILRQCPDMIQTVCASKAETFWPFIKDFESWTRQEFWHAIGQLKHYSGISARFCFFIDGLDEYDGDPDRLVDLLENLRSWQNIKLCVSSRPWNEFIDAFGRPSDAQLAMEDLTRKDIRVYVRETLEDNLLFRRLDARDPRSQDLVREIVEKARGVFLWVTLVVKSLLTGLKNADRIPDLGMRLRDFPATLEQYFSLILHSVEVIYRKQTAQAFKFALEEAEPLSFYLHIHSSTRKTSTLY